MIIDLKSLKLNINLFKPLYILNLNNFQYLYK